MLSSPPAAVRRVHQRPRAVVEVAAVLAQDRSITSPSTMSDRPSEQMRIHVARRAVDRERVDVDVRIGAERARDHRPLWMHLRGLRRQLAAPDQLGDERMVVGQLLEPVVAQQVGARVADVAEGRRCPSSSTSATVIVVPMPDVSASVDARS